MELFHPQLTPPTEFVFLPAIILLSAATVYGFLLSWAGILKSSRPYSLSKFLAPVSLFLSGLSCFLMCLRIGSQRGFFSSPGFGDWENPAKGALLEFNSMGLIFCGMGLMWIGILAWTGDKEDFPSPMLRLLQGMGLWGALLSADLVAMIIFFAVFSAAHRALEPGPRAVLWGNLVPMALSLSGIVFLAAVWGSATLPDFSPEGSLASFSIAARAAFACFLGGLVLWAIRLGGNLGLFLVFGIVLRVAVRLPVESHVFIAGWAWLLILGHCFRLVRAKQGTEFLRASGGYLIGLALLFAAGGLRYGSSELGWDAFRTLWVALWISCLSQTLDLSGDAAEGGEGWGWWLLIPLLAAGALPPGGAFYGVIHLSGLSGAGTALLLVVWALVVSRALKFSWKQAEGRTRRILQSRGPQRVWIWVATGAILSEGLFSGLSRIIFLDAGAILSGQ